MSDPEARPPSGDGRGEFFAVDRRAWARVCRLGMNPAVAYLVLARGTGGDNRTSKWSTNAIERYTGISRSRAAQAIADLEQDKAVVRDPASKRSRPKYKIVPAYEIPGCEGFPPPELTEEERRVFDAIAAGHSRVPKSVFRTMSYDGLSPAEKQELQLWGNWRPREVAERLAEKGWVRRQGKEHFLPIGYDAEVVARPDWTWLPNALIDGAAGETAPVEVVRETGSAPTLRLLVDLYGSQNLNEDGGVHFRRILQEYARHKVGEHGPYVVWGFAPGTVTAWSDAPFVAPHLAHAAGDKDKLAADWKEFWGCWNRLRNIGLVEIVTHLVDADTAEGEVIHPMARDGTGLEVEREVAAAARRAALTMVTPGQRDWAAKQGVVALAPVLRHIERVQMLGIARLRYRPKTSRTLAFAAREAEWREVFARMDEIAQGDASSQRDDAAAWLATSR